MKHLVLFATLALCAATSFSQTPDSSVASDNTKMNKAPVNSTEKSSTADGQSNSASDVKITQQIRKSLMADKSLSTYGHNVKIVTVNGAVTLNGTVHSTEEKSAIATKAQAVVGDGHVTNDIKIASQN